MYKKIVVILFLILSLCSFTICYAENDMQNASNSVKNTVNGAENSIENAAKSTGDAIKDGTTAAGNAMRDGTEKFSNAVKDGASAAGKAVENGANNAKNAIQNTITGNNNYDATRTSGEGTFMGMTSNTWSWLILGIAAIAIIALVWYYSAQMNNNKHYNDHE